MCSTQPPDSAPPSRDHPLSAQPDRVRTSQVGVSRRRSMRHTPISNGLVCLSRLTEEETYAVLDRGMINSRPRKRACSGSIRTCRRSEAVRNRACSVASGSVGRCAQVPLERIPSIRLVSPRFRVGRWGPRLVPQSAPRRGVQVGDFPNWGRIRGTTPKSMTNKRR